MGYTHYWRHDQKLNGKALFAAFQDARKIVEAAKAKGIQLRGGGGEGEPVVDEAIWLNGARELDEDCETFAFPVTGSTLKDSMVHGGYPSDFCKTARLPYDVVVCAILLVLKHHLGEQIRIASDGARRADEWLPAERMVQEVLGYTVRFQSEREYFKR